MSEQALYRVVFQNQGEMIEIYARSVGAGGIFGFVQISELVFGERTAIVIDPAEEKLRQQFADVSSFHVPIHAVIRIDEVSKRGPAKITPIDADGSKVTPFPVYTSTGKDS